MVDVHGYFPQPCHVVCKGALNLSTSSKINAGAASLLAAVPIKTRITKSDWHIDGVTGEVKWKDPKLQFYLGGVSRSMIEHVGLLKIFRPRRGNRRRQKLGVTYTPAYDIKFNRKKVSGNMLFLGTLFRPKEFGDQPVAPLRLQPASFADVILDPSYRRGWVCSEPGFVPGRLDFVGTATEHLLADLKTFKFRVLTRRVLEIRKVKRGCRDSGMSTG